MDDLHSLIGKVYAMINGILSTDWTKWCTCYKLLLSCVVCTLWKKKHLSPKGA